MPERTRRDVLKGLGIAGAALVTPTVTASESEDRFILDVGERVTTEDQYRVNDTDLETRHNQEEIGYLVVEGKESEVEKLPYDYAPDMDLELDTPSESYEPSEEELEAMQEAADGLEPGPEDAHFDVPNLYPYQWDKQYLNHQEALQEATGEGVTIAIIDSSVWLEHPDLTDNANLEDSISVIDDGFGVWADDPEADDHGTHVAGIAAASDGGDVVGVAPDAEIIGVRYFSPTESGGSSDFIEAVMHSARNADVINTSLGFPPLPNNRFWRAFFEDYYKSVDTFARAQDAVWVSSAGNDATNVDEENQIIMPAGLEGNLSISSTGPIGYGYQLFEGEPLIEQPYSPSNFTDHGADYVDLSAPGGDYDIDMVEPIDGRRAYAYDLVFSTTFEYSSGETVPSETADEEPTVLNPRWGWKAGTSMAAPNVAGAAALLREKFPDAPAHQIQRLLKEHTQTVGEPEFHGNGHLSLLNTLEAPDPSEQRPGRHPREGGRDDRSRDDTGSGSGDGGSGGSGSRGRSRDDDDDDDDDDGRGRSR